MPSRIASSHRSARTEIVAARRRISFVEEQVDDAQHTVDPFRQIFGARWIDDDVVISNLSFRAYETLRDRRLRREKARAISEVLKPHAVLSVKAI